MKKEVTGYVKVLFPTCCHYSFLPSFLPSFLTHPMVQDILWKVGSCSACQRISCFLYGTQRFITVLTKACHQALSCVSCIQFASSTHFSLRSIIVLSSHQCLGLHSGLFPLGLPAKKKETSPLHVYHMLCPPHPHWFNHPNSIRWRIQAVKFIIMHFSPRFVFLPFRSKYPQHLVNSNV